MASICRSLAVPSEEVYRVLEDARALRILVPGARRIRRFDPRWPDVGSRVHHTSGVYPLVLRDTTEVLECDPGRRLVLVARLQALGAFEVCFDLSPEGQGTRLGVTERPVGGPFRLPLLRSVAEIAVALRNIEMMRRFDRLVRHRARVRSESIDRQRPEFADRHGGARTSG